MNRECIRSSSPWWPSRHSSRPLPDQSLPYGTRSREYICSNSKIGGIICLPKNKHRHRGVYTPYILVVDIKGITKNDGKNARMRRKTSFFPESDKSGIRSLADASLGFRRIYVLNRSRGVNELGGYIYHIWSNKAHLFLQDYGSHIWVYGAITSGH